MKTRRLLLLLACVSLYVLISWLILTVPTEVIVSYIHIENAPLLMFVLGLLGGVTSFTGIPYHVVLVSVAAGGRGTMALGSSDCSWGDDW